MILLCLMCTVSIFAQPDIKAGEYFLGTIDPGNGKGTSISVVDGAWDEVVENIIATAQTITSTTSPTLINIRLKDNSNNWGPLFKKTLFFNASTNSRSVDISAAEYFIGFFDPGQGQGTPIIAFDGAMDDAVETVLRTSATWTVTTGPTLFNIRLRDAYNNWGPLFKKTIFPYGANTNVKLIKETGPITICKNSNVTLTYNGPNGFATTWFDGSKNSTITFTPKTIGYYGVSATLGNNTYVDSIYVDFLPSPTPTINLAGSILVCGSSAITLSTTATPNTTFQWYLNNTLISSATSANYLPTEVGSYYVEATSTLNSCVGKSNSTTLFTVASITPSGSVSSCTNPVVLSTSEGTGNTYQWKLNGGNIQNATTSTYNATSSGAYSVTITNGTCISTSANTNVTINPTPEVPTISTSGTTTFCAGGSVTFTSSSAIGNTWSNGATTQSIIVTETGNYSVTVSNGTCSATSSTTNVTVNPSPTKPTINASGATTFCAGGSVTLTSSSVTGNTWSNGATTQSIIVSESGDHSVTVSNGICSATSSSTAVIVNPLPTKPTINASGATTFCSGGSITLTSSSSTGNTWSNGATTQATTVTASGDYSVTVSNGTCSVTSSLTTINVEAGQKITSQPSNQTAIIAGTSQFGIISSNANSTYQWQTDLGVGFQNISNVGQYSGTTNNTLKVSNITLINNNQKFHCIVTSGNCMETSNTAVLTVNNTMGLNEQNAEILFSVYPNPANNYINIKADQKLYGSAFTIYDLVGKSVLQGKIVAETSKIELSSLSSGFYLIKIEGNYNKTFRIGKE